MDIGTASRAPGRSEILRVIWKERAGKYVHYVKKEMSFDELSEIDRAGDEWRTIVTTSPEIGHDLV